MVGCGGAGTLAITWPQGVAAKELCHTVAAQVNGVVREWQESQVQEVVTLAQSPSPLLLQKSAR